MITFIIFIVVYIIFIAMTLFKPERFGNILTVLGIIISNIMVFYTLADMADYWIMYVLIHALFAFIFCFLIDIVSKKVYQYRINNGINIKVKKKNKVVAGFLAVILGGFGAHKFYLGKKSQGAIYAMLFYTLIPGILGIIEGIRYWTMDKKEFDLRYNSGVPLPDDTIKTEVLENMSPSPSERVIENKPVHKERIEEHSKIIDFNNIQTTAGTVSVFGVKKDSMTIKIIDKSGKEYEFYTMGNAIESFKVNGRAQKKYREV